MAKRETISIDLLENITVYAGAGIATFPSCTSSNPFRARQRVKESIFREKLTMDCLRGDAVSFFNHSNISKICPPLEAFHGVAALAYGSPRPSRCAARRARAGCLHRQLQANRLSRAAGAPIRRLLQFYGHVEDASREAATVAL
ncbi:MAG: hypothetical protein ACLT98_13995 [Eggerthellaceae bacterium]